MSYPAPPLPPSGQPYSAPPPATEYSQPLHSAASYSPPPMAPPPPVAPPQPSYAQPAMPPPQTPPQAAYSPPATPLQPSYAAPLPPASQPVPAYSAPLPPPAPAYSPPPAPAYSPPPAPTYAPPAPVSPQPSAYAAPAPASPPPAYAPPVEYSPPPAAGAVQADTFDQYYSDPYPTTSSSPYPSGDAKSQAIAAAAAQYQAATGTAYPGEVDPYALAAAQQAAQMQAQGQPVEAGYVEPAEPSRFPQLERYLSTEQGFVQSVEYTGLANRILLIVLTVALLALGYNIYDTLRSLVSQKLPFNRYFWPMFFTIRDTTGSINYLFAIEVWLPIIAIPVVLIVMLIGLLTKGRSTAKLFYEYQRGGFVAELMQTGLKVVSKGTSPSNMRLNSLIDIATGNNGGSGMVLVFGHPSIPRDTVVEAARHINNAASSAAYAHDMAKFMGRNNLFGRAAMLARLADSDLDDGLYLTALPSGTPPVVRVVVPDPNLPAGMKIYKLKKSVPLG